MSLIVNQMRVLVILRVAVLCLLECHCYLIFFAAALLQMGNPSFSERFSCLDDVHLSCNPFPWISIASKSLLKTSKP